MWCDPDWSMAVDRVLAIGDLAFALAATEHLRLLQNTGLTLGCRTCVALFLYRMLSSGCLEALLLAFRF